jgi:hypothetical protein
MDDEVDKLRRKAYERELAKLHIELVKLQEWVKHTGRQYTSDGLGGQTALLP